MKEKVWYVLGHIEDIIAQAFFALMSIAVFAQLISRIIFRNPLFFSEEIARYSYVWIVFMCIPLAERTKEHYNVTLFVGFLKGKAAKAVDILGHIICVGLFIYMLYWAILFLPFNAIIKSPALEFSMAYISVSMIISFALCIVRRGKLLVEDVKNFGKEETQT